MPTYRIKDPTTGKTLTLTGDSPPTESEISSIFAGVKAKSAEAAQPADKPKWYQPGGDETLDEIRAGYKVLKPYVPAAAVGIASAVSGGMLIPALAGGGTALAQGIATGDSNDAVFADTLLNTAGGALPGAWAARGKLAPKAAAIATDYMLPSGVTRALGKLGFSIADLVGGGTKVAEKAAETAVQTGTGSASAVLDVDAQKAWQAAFKMLPKAEQKAAQTAVAESAPVAKAGQAVVKTAEKAAQKVTEKDIPASWQALTSSGVVQSMKGALSNKIFANNDLAQQTLKMLNETPEMVKDPMVRQTIEKFIKESLFAAKKAAEVVGK